MKTAAKMRNEVLNGFDDLQPKFSTIEHFFGLWPGDNRIHEASVDLIVATMTAIEFTIGFFLRPSCRFYVPPSAILTQHLTHSSTSREESGGGCLERGRLREQG